MSFNFLKNGKAPTKTKYGNVVETFDIFVKIVKNLLAAEPPNEIKKIKTQTTIAWIHIANAGIPALFNFVTFSGHKSGSEPIMNDLIGE